MKICIVPIDNRPVCYSLIKDICAIDSNIEIFMPPKIFLGDLTKNANTEQILEWLNFIPDTDVTIIALDTLIYGGLISSRRSTETLEELKIKLNEIKSVLKNKKSKIYAFSSIMRISNNNYNEEEKIYWKDYGKKLFEYSYNMYKYGVCENSCIPDEILRDYLNTRKRNFEINKIYLEWQKEGIFDTLIFSKDDCAEYGYNVMEAQELEKMGGKTKTGADEIPLTLLARSIEKNVSVYVSFTEPDYTDRISNYEDVSIKDSVFGQLELGGFNVVNSQEESDIVLVVNNFIEKQGELVMGWDTIPFDKELELPKKPFAIADVRYANGADNKFVVRLLEKLTPLPPAGTSPTSGEDDACPHCEIFQTSKDDNNCLSPLWRKCHKVTKGSSHHQYYAPYMKEFTRELRQNMTHEEVKIWQQIRRNQLGVKFRRQYQINNKYIADFVCLDKQLIIEIDGGQHCNSFDDVQRTFYLENLGFKVIRFWNNEVNQNINGCIEFLKRILDTPLPPAGTSPTSGEDDACPPCQIFQASKDDNNCLSTLPGADLRTAFCHLSPLWGKCHEVTKGGSSQDIYPLCEENIALQQNQIATDFYGYAGWNTSANTIGTILATIKVKWLAGNYNHNAFKHLQIIRFLDDWAYQANVRKQISEPCDISDLMQPYEKKLSSVFDCEIKAKYNYPWNRKFETEILY